MYELLVLALLMQWPLHAYLIASIAGDIIGPWEKISRGSLSALLARLEQTGCIATADPAQVPFRSERSSRVFAITPAGRDRFYQLMMDTKGNQGIYQRLFHIKALHLDFLPFQDQLYLVDHYLTYCQTSIRYQKTEAQDFATDPMKQTHASQHFSAVALDFMDLVAQQWQLELAWTQRLRERIISSQTK